MKTVRNLGRCRAFLWFCRNSLEKRKKEKLSNKIQEYYGLEERYVEIEIAGGEGPVDFSSDGGGDPVYSGIPGGK